MRATDFPASARRLPTVTGDGDSGSSEPLSVARNRVWISRPNSALTILIVTLLTYLVAGCSTIPLVEHEVDEHSWPTPAETPIGSYFAANGPGDPDLSGVLLLDKPSSAFRARFAMAQRATRTLDMQYYLWKGDLTGRLLLWSALEAADRGVKVRLLIDDIYHSGRDDVYGLIASHPNFSVRVFNPMKHRGVGKKLNYALNRSTLNSRMHNKIFLVDNAALVIGGRNIGDDYFGIDPRLNFHDLDVLAVGPVAEEAGAAYDMYWNSPYAVPIERLDDSPSTPQERRDARDELDRYLDDRLGEMPYRVPANPAMLEDELALLAARLTWARSRIVVDPLERFTGAETAFAALGAEVARAADRSITVQTAYLIPVEGTQEGIRQLVDRGVRIRLMTNSLMSNNHVSVHGHYAKHRKRLLEAGAELYELRANAALLEHFQRQDDALPRSHAGLHTKAFVVDDDLSGIGSYNMDPRSHVWNSEITLLVYGQEFGRKVLGAMDALLDPAYAYEVYLDEHGRVRWRAEDAAGDSRVWTGEPESTFWRRLAARFFGILPIGGEL